LMFVLSRWSGGLTASVGSRMPLTVGPVVAAVGFALFARTGVGDPYWTSFFPAVVMLALGMVIVVAPLTTTAMSAVDAQHAGVASGVNNAVARLAGLIAIAVLGIVLVQGFDTRVRPRLERAKLSHAARVAVEAQLPKLAGADIPAGMPEHAVVRRAIDEAFVASFRLVMMTAAVLAFAAAGAGALIRDVPVGREGPGARLAEQPQGSGGRVR